MDKKEAIEQLKIIKNNIDKKYINTKNSKAIETVLNLLEKKDEIINNAIIEIENLRQYFSEDLQPDFIGILEILKDKKVIDW